LVPIELGVPKGVFGKKKSGQSGTREQFKNAKVEPRQSNENLGGRTTWRISGENRGPVEKRL